MKKLNRAVVAIGCAAALVLAIAQPASAATTSGDRACNISGTSSGTLHMSFSTSSAYSDEKYLGANSECGTVYVQIRYYAYVGGPAYLSGWQSSPTKAVYSHANTYASQHKATYMAGSSPAGLPT